MFLVPSPIKALYTHIIAPHGITDVFHAHHTQNYRSLFTSYAGSMLVSAGLHQFHLDNVLWFGFCFASCFHFRHDLISIFPKVSPDLRHQLWITGSLLSILIQQPNWFLIYMVLLHVPNHYRMAWKYTRPSWKALLASIALVAFVCDTQYDYVLQNQHWDWIIGIVLGHIVYEEKCVHSRESSLEF